MRPDYIIKVTLALAALVMLAACGGNEASTPESKASAEQSAPAQASEEIAQSQEEKDEASTGVLGLIDTPNPQVLPIGISKGELAPNFRLITDKGDSIVLSDFRGKPVLLNFFAVWCAPCRYEMPELEKVHQRMGDQVMILAVDIREPPERVAGYREILGLTFTMALDRDRQVANRYQVPGLPFTFILDSDGVIRYVRIGAFISEAEILESLELVGIEAGEESAQPSTSFPVRSDESELLRAR